MSVGADINGAQKGGWWNDQLVKGIAAVGRQREGLSGPGQGGHFDALREPDRRVVNPTIRFVWSVWV